LRAHLQVRGRVQSRMIRTAGISEAALAERIDDIAANLAPLTLAFLPQTASVDLRVTCWGDVADADVLLDGAVARLRERLGTLAYAVDDTDLALHVGRMLRAAGLTLALAESCTGGLVAKRLTDFAGSSEYVHASFVT